MVKRKLDGTVDESLAEQQIHKRSGYFAGHRLRYKNLFCRSLISSCWTLGLGFGLGYRRMMDVRVRVRVRVWIRI